jgi:hypothetical protein
MCGWFSGVVLEKSVVGFLTLFLCTGTKKVLSTNGLGVIRTPSLIGETSVVFRVKGLGFMFCAWARAVFNQSQLDA